MTFHFISTWLVVLILFAHYLADYIFQTHWMASNKSKSIWPLLAHIATYTTIFGLCFGPKYALINGGLHLVIDFITSRLTSKLWAAGKIRPFFLVLGADQFLHSLCLFSTVGYLHMWWL